ncbi:MAG: TadE/TadG family type IV pilus assembly protein [Chloroflexota bacterium]
MRLWREQTGAALVEYVLIFPLVLLLFFGSLEIFRLLSVKESLRGGLKEAVVCLSHSKDEPTLALYQCDPVERVREELKRNPFAVRPTGVVVYVDGGDWFPTIRAKQYGEVFEARAEVTVPLGYLYPFKGGPTITLAERTVSFVDSAPSYFQLWIEAPFPNDPGPLP